VSALERRDAFWASVEEAAARVEHAANLGGKTRARCAQCNGKGHTAPGYTDYDGQGAFYVHPEYCTRCNGECSVEVPCSPDVEAAAVQREIDKLKTRLRELKRKRGAAK
jgi:hypothetical protein